MPDELRPVVKSINQVLETKWSLRQLNNGKWFEISASWSPPLIRSLMRRYKEAGWIVTRNVELTSTDGVTRYLVFSHPKYHTPGASTIPS